MESSSSSPPSSLIWQTSSKQQLLERFRAVHMKEPSVASLSAENSQQLHSQSDTLSDLVLLRKNYYNYNSNSETLHLNYNSGSSNNTAGTEIVHQIGKQQRQQKEELSVRGTSSKLYNKRFLNFLPNLDQQQPQQVNTNSSTYTTRHFNRGFVSTDKQPLAGGKSRIKEHNYIILDNNSHYYSPLFFESFKGFPEVRGKGSKSENCANNQRRGSHQSQFYRIPKLLEQAFQPDVHRSYSYKCAVRNTQNILSPQTVTISLSSPPSSSLAPSSTSKQKQQAVAQLGNNNVSTAEKATFTTEGHFALAPIQLQQQR